MKPTIGRTVLFTLTKQHADEINRRRTTGLSISERIKVLAWPLGAQAHIGNTVQEGETYPLVITRVWGDQPTSAFNGQLMLDGNDTYWVTSVSIVDEPIPGFASWPVIEPRPVPAEPSPAQA
jgi:hypothetical protein